MLRLEGPRTSNGGTHSCRSLSEVSDSPFGLLLFSGTPPLTSATTPLTPRVAAETTSHATGESERTLQSGVTVPVSIAVSTSGAESIGWPLDNSPLVDQNAWMIRDNVEPVPESESARSE